ncbi:MAG TPA: hypothetical protein PLN61_00365 [bacterium]|nr:hypothetical protein [bacterium]HQI47094.1 hypothetical protein [bacterium]HQJ65349.1 hypothetical protein [bacterium]
MKSRKLMWLLPLLVLACDESLPPRQEPQNTLAITQVIYTQGMYASGPFMEFVFIITNLYEETFQGEVAVNGHATVWWKNRPQIRTTLAINNQHFTPPSRLQGNTLTIDPGGRCALKIYWYLTLEDGRSLLDLLDYSDSVPVEGLIKSRPETFVMEATIKLFDQTGYLRSEPFTFSFTGYKAAPASGGQ